MNSVSINLPNEQATIKLGADLARADLRGAVIYLQGELGAGKTTFVRGLLTHLGHQGAVRSPTYALVEIYQVNNQPLVHVDLYRLRDPGDVENLGLRELADGETIMLIEWPQYGAGYLPAADLTIALAYQGSARVASLHAASTRGQKVLSCLSCSV